MSSLDQIINSKCSHIDKILAKIGKLLHSSFLLTICIICYLYRSTTFIISQSPLKSKWVFSQFINHQGYFQMTEVVFLLVK